ncbi:patatin-like phospholipase family protein [Amycolatopsis sp. RTGN1]|uniref:patatin-like phospholipase family protein n=1 Tax=Amycolatopsis ponsaeliensis TaxID=2992142 RepID=UPI00254B5CFF|nr:patatin-like phospholipase family protein [Amycolatopsis sp. RTGN1]
MISIAIQGGAMRSIYCVGAVRAIVEAGYGHQVKTIHAASAGCVSAAVLANQVSDENAPSVAEVTDILLSRLASTRFINQRRLNKIVDVDYLVETMRDVTSISCATLGGQGIVFEVAATDAYTASAEYFDVAKCENDADLVLALRATMAIPVLYPIKVTIGGRKYVDGGISDPLPALRAFRHNPDVVVAISSVPSLTLAEVADGKEARIIRYAPGISSSVRNLMLTRNPLAGAVDSLMELDSFMGARVVRISPSDPTLVCSRVETDELKLRKLEALGYSDAVKALSQLQVDL